MIRAKSTLLVLSLAALAVPAAADDVNYIDVDGIRYRETTQVIQKPVTETRYEQRETTGYRERYTTDLQESVRTYQVPVTEHQWVLGTERSWNIFAQPKLSYKLMPVTRWETRTETVKVPVTKREYVPERQVQHIPITNTKIGEERIVRREIVGPVPSGGGSAIARSEASLRYGEQQPATGLDAEYPSSAPSVPRTVDTRR